MLTKISECLIESLVEVHLTLNAKLNLHEVPWDLLQKLIFTILKKVAII